MKIGRIRSGREENREKLEERPTSLKK